MGDSIRIVYSEVDDSADIESERSYGRSVKHKKICIILTIVVAVITVIAALAVTYPMSLEDFLYNLTHIDTSTINGRVIWLIELPMIAIAIIAGIGLSLSGTVMQCILKNPLASPYTLGLSSAAAFGAAFSIVVLDSGASISNSFLDAYSTMIWAFVFSMAATGFIIMMTKITNVSSETMVLAGIAIGAIFSAALTLMQYFADSAQLSAIVSWSFGDLNHSNWQWNMIMLCITLPVLAYFIYNRWNLNALDAGDEVAKGLGVNTERFRMISLILTAFLSSMLVSRYGVIAFIGLIGPHIARMIVGSDHRFLIPMSVITGGTILLIANVVAVNIVAPMVLPVGLLTSLLGGPMFLYLLIRRYRR